MEVDLLVDIANTFDFGLIVEGADRNIAFCNQKALEIFDIDDAPNGFIGKNYRDLLVLTKLHIKKSELFEWNFNNIPNQFLKNESAFNTILDRTIRIKYTPLFHNSVMRNHIWQFDDITELELKEFALIKQKEYTILRL
jgi:hypothetical protein